MTDLATAMSNVTLTPFDGRDVVRTTIAITNAGDGLSQAMAVDPRELHHGERVFVVLECEVAKVSFAPIKDTELLARVHTLRAGTATMVDEDLVIGHLTEQRERIVEAQERAGGIRRLPYNGDNADAGDEEDEE